MSPLTLALLFGAGALGGALNAVAGGGSFIVFPALMAAGLGPVAANATTTGGLWPAGLASAWAYRREAKKAPLSLWLALSVPSLVGGAIGAVVLLGTRDETFAKALPGLLLFATLVLTFGKRIFRSRTGEPTALVLVGAALVQTFVSVYGGFFGGGMGILMLATFSVTGMKDIHAMNALKTVLGVLINGAAVVLFVVRGKVDLTAAAAVAAGSVAGGYLGARLAQRIDPAKVRAAIIVFAWGLTLYFAFRVYAAR
jgi:uncharacterized membrane protein YfcA